MTGMTGIVPDGFFLSGEDSGPQYGGVLALRGQ